MFIKNNFDNFHCRNLRFCGENYIDTRGVIKHMADYKNSSKSHHNVSACFQLRNSFASHTEEVHRILKVKVKQSRNRPVGPRWFQQV
jgi:hypothetical protein